MYCFKKILGQSLCMKGQNITQCSISILNSECNISYNFSKKNTHSTNFFIKDISSSSVIFGSVNLAFNSSEHFARAICDNLLDTLTTL